jgi:hypothetical protein
MPTEWTWCEHSSNDKCKSLSKKPAEVNAEGLLRPPALMRTGLLLPTGKGFSLQGKRTRLQRRRRYVLFRQSQDFTGAPFPPIFNDQAFVLL